MTTKTPGRFERFGKSGARHAIDLVMSVGASVAGALIGLGVVPAPSLQSAGAIAYIALGLAIINASSTSILGRRVDTHGTTLFGEDRDG